ncbi:unnamed protein product [Ilex paraguariensis]|uniref:Uncharacterized protein n=1 Tax=Ilex paraguariensis TaxID=185542 RepID=A0ABC8TI97_9AQUA
MKHKWCRILGISTSQLQENFYDEASDSVKHPSCYARNFLEYCCFRAVALSVQATGYLEDTKFRRLTFDMMIAWEVPAAASEPLLNVDADVTVGVEAFSRIAPAVPIIANVIISENLFEVLTASTGDRLQFSVYEKCLTALERYYHLSFYQLLGIKKIEDAIRVISPLCLSISKRGKILEVDRTVTTQPVLQHLGISTWPGRLTLTDHALYFEALHVVSYDQAKVYDLSDELKQVVRPELTGPWGTRLFDKAVLYKSIFVSEPTVMEFPELKGHTRRDYWLFIIREILYAHRFIDKFRIIGVEQDEALLKAILGILRVQALKDINSTIPLCCEDLLIFNVCDQHPGGDLILETLADMSTSRELERTDSSKAGSRMYSISASAMPSNLGFVVGTSSGVPIEAGLLVDEIRVGEISSLGKAVKESKSSYKKVVIAQATVDGAKVEGIDTNLGVIKELLYPVAELGKQLLSKSLLFCLVFTYIIFREGVFIVLTRWFDQGRPVRELKDGNIGLFKLRTLLLSIFPQSEIVWWWWFSDGDRLKFNGVVFVATVMIVVVAGGCRFLTERASEKVAVALLVMALIMIFLSRKYIILGFFLETFTKYSPLRKASTERWTRRLREWWFSIPAAPVVLEGANEDKKKK